MGYGENESKGLPGYKKALSQPYLSELFDAPPAAPPDAGLPWTVGGYEDNPLIEDRPTPAPPRPDRGIKEVGRCKSCGSFGFSATDAATCPSCGDAEAMVSGLYTPGTPWF
jgi:hypothetical protein